MILFSAKFLKVFHSSQERLLCVESFISSEKRSFSTQLKNTSKLACSLGDFHPDLGLKAVVSLKLLNMFFIKQHGCEGLRSQFT